MTRLSLEGWRRALDAEADPRRYATAAAPPRRGIR
jgi:hypothetical protein